MTVQMKRRVALWLAAWAVVSTASVALHFAVRQRGGGATRLQEALVPLANAMHVVALPATSILRGTGLAARLPSVVVTSLAAAGGWLLAVGGLAVLNECRLRLVSVSVRGGPPAFDAGRRRFIVNSAFGVAGVGATAAGAKATVIDPGDIVVRRYAVPIRGLPASLEGLRLVQLSDTHLGPAVPASHVRRAVEMARGLGPDVFVLTGDYIQASTAFIDEAARLFEPLVATGRAVLGVLGNHDWYGDGPGVRAAMRGVGVRMIDNSRVFLGADRRCSAEPLLGGVCFAGLGDLDEDRVDVEAAFAGVGDEMPRIVLAHQPDTLETERVRGLRIDVALCGHTHGGQVSLPMVGPLVVPSRFGAKYAGGLVPGPSGAVVVSRGIGMSILPIRWNVPPEVVEVTLVRSGG